MIMYSHMISTQHYKIFREKLERFSIVMLKACDSENHSTSHAAESFSNLFHHSSTDQFANGVHSIPERIPAAFGMHWYLVSLGPQLKSVKV